MKSYFRKTSNLKLKISVESLHENNMQDFSLFIEQVIVTKSLLIAFSEFVVLAIS